MARENPISTEDDVSREAVVNDQTQARGVITVESWDDQSHGTGLVTIFREMVTRVWVRKLERLSAVILSWCVRE